MCYSAQVWADYRQYVRNFGAELSVKDFFDLFWRRLTDNKIVVPKAIEAPFTNPQSDQEGEILSLIEKYAADESLRIERVLFEQRQRLTEAERQLLVKETKAASESQRIATKKIEQARRWLAHLRRTELVGQDSRIYPGNYAPVMVMEDGKRVVKPMRYLCRRAGKSATEDKKYFGCYNARRDNLEAFWKGQFGYTHGVLVVNAFYENVNLHRTEHRELLEVEKVQNVVLEFKPRPTQDMLVACIWSHWTGAGEPDLLSFAAITDEPPADVAAAGHDRCIVPIQPHNIDAWLNPNPKNLDAMYAILDDRERPYYEYRLAA